jgi:MoaA/NifB/PqqE/SkfB family radical SAM enzyme
MSEYRLMLKVLLIKVKEKLLRGSVCPAFFDITSRCNLKCPHCYFFRGRQTRDLSPQEWEGLFAKYKKRHFHHAVLSGGEPTLNQDVIFLANKFFPIVNIATNGLIKIPPAIRHTILVSLDGQETTHESIRGKGTFEKVLANYKDDKRVIYRMTINKLNLNEIVPVTQIAQRNNVRGISFIIHAPYLQKDALCLSQDELEEVRTKLLAVIKKYGKFVYLTPKMLHAMVYSTFGQDCELKGSVALYSDGTPKKCSMNNVDCATCKCPTPALMHVYKTDLKTLLLGLRYY